jgi:SPP1 gp7 family putative phage head morphogenesis protein
MSSDPTRTKTLRDEHSREYGRRFRELKGEIRTAIEDRDVLHLGRQRARNAAPNPRQYQFLTDEAKQERFEDWVGRQIDDDILVVQSSRKVRNGEHYSGPFIRKAYAKGLRDAGVELRKRGVDVSQETLEDVFTVPAHREKLQRLHTRVFENLDDITEDMSDEVSDTLSESLSQGHNPRKAARNLNERVDTVGLTRSRLLARTEIINAHAEGTLDRLDREGFDRVEVDVEFSTAGDARVCPICAGLRGNTYTISEARGRVPQHPGCRCAFLPVVDSSG